MDDLVKRLLSETLAVKHRPEKGYIPMNPDGKDAVEALEALTAERDSAQGELSRLRSAIEAKGGTEHYPTEWAYLKACDVADAARADLAAAEAKLAQAVEVLQRIETASEYFAGPEAPDMSCRYAPETTKRLARAFLATIQPEGEPDDKA